MNYLSAAQLSAMMASLIVSSLLALWYFVPWASRSTRRDALLALLWLHVPRYVTLIMYSAQHGGYPISNRAAFEAVTGDVLGAALALLAIIAIQSSAMWARSAGVWLSWLLTAETIVDMTIGIVRKAHEPLWGKSEGVTWLILDFYIPLLMVSVPLLVWQLLSRGREPMSAVGAFVRRCERPRQTTAA
jgi:hypothetical protein